MRRAWAFRVVGALVIGLFGRAAYTLFQHLVGAHPGAGQDLYAILSGAFGLLIVAVFGIGVLWADRDGKAIARRMLSDPGSSTVLLIGRDDAKSPDGRLYAALRRGDLAWRLKRPKGPRATVVHRDGDLLFAVERRGKELWLISSEGADEAFLWLPPTSSPRETSLFRADGSSIGTIALDPRTVTGVYALRDGHGNGIGVAARYTSRTWVLRIAGTAPPLLRDMAMAFFFESRC